LLKSKKKINSPPSWVKIYIGPLPNLYKECLLIYSGFMWQMLILYNILSGFRHILLGSGLIFLLSLDEISGTYVQDQYLEKFLPV